MKNISTLSSMRETIGYKARWNVMMRSYMPLSAFELFLCAGRPYVNCITPYSAKYLSTVSCKSYW